MIHKLETADAADVDRDRIGAWIARRLWPRAPKADRASQARPG